MIRTRKNNKKESTKCALACTSRARVLSYIQAFKIARRVTAVSCSTHQQKFKQQLTPWSVTSEVSASDPSHGVECHGPKQHNYQMGDPTLRCTTRKRMVPNLVVFSLVAAHFTNKIHGERWRAILLATFHMIDMSCLTRLALANLLLQPVPSLVWNDIAVSPMTVTAS